MGKANEGLRLFPKFLAMMQQGHGDNIGDPRLCFAKSGQTTWPAPNRFTS